PAEHGGHGESTEKRRRCLHPAVLATPKRDSSTARPDPEIDTADLRERLRRRDAALRMTCGEGVRKQHTRFRLKFEDINMTPLPARSAHLSPARQAGRRRITG